MEKLKDKYDPNSVVQIKQQASEESNESSQLPASNMGTPTMPSAATLAADSATDDKDTKPEDDQDMQPENDKDIKLEDDKDGMPEVVTASIPPPQSETPMDPAPELAVEPEPHVKEETGMDVSEEAAVKDEASNPQTEEVRETQDVEMK